jgi:hypothetical protein
MRLFRDKLVCDEDRSQFDSIITRVLQSEWSRDSILEKLSGMQFCRYVQYVVFLGMNINNHHVSETCITHWQECTM